MAGDEPFVDKLNGLESLREYNYQSLVAAHLIMAGAEDIAEVEEVSAG